MFESFRPPLVYSITLDHTSIAITSTYCPPKYTTSPNQFKNFFSTLDNKFIVGVTSERSIYNGVNTQTLHVTALFDKSLMLITIQSWPLQISHTSQYLPGSTLKF